MTTSAPTLVLHSKSDSGISYESTTHGWSSPEEAVKHWKTLPSFNAYKNGRRTTNGDGVETRTWFTAS
ncbi:hypothetical protein [Frigoribacterium sp. VKM Ac-2530]|uniref:hypothetical protein n=1 Tax=Frigoribacterium sp. VKM Ac-2530 TaxID=2783822 RepID=UPI001889DAD1|nr:hypothetical protein [Frigoribacterium sp. VKM Ac-2530]MBF4578900.1 hypothetical protein [Frigoribacterium sp. VKM Ac-2530]